MDFFTVDAVWLQRVYVLFFIEVGSSRVHLAGCTAHPDDEWVTQQARQVAWTLAERTEPVRFLTRDQDRKFTGSFDAVFEAEGVRVVRTPIRVPEANGIAERFVRTVRSECLDWLVIVNGPHLERVLAVFIDHYNGWRPRRSLDLAPPSGRRAAPIWMGTEPITVNRRDRLGGLFARARARGVSQIAVCAPHRLDPPANRFKPDVMGLEIRPKRCQQQRQASGKNVVRPLVEPNIISPVGLCQVPCRPYGLRRLSGSPSDSEKLRNVLFVG